MRDIMELFQKISGENTKTGGAPTYIVCGLGNPGDNYARTRHNAGFLAMDYISQKVGAPLRRLRFQSLSAETEMAGARVLLLKPQTYMNASGAAVREAASYYHIPPEHVLVLVDDICLAPGRMRIRKSGSAGGHNGLKSIIEQLSSDAFPRIRLGVGEKPSADYDLADWVLGKLSEEDCRRMYPCLEDAYLAVEMLIQGKADEAMGRFNGKKTTDHKTEKI